MHILNHVTKRGLIVAAMALLALALLPSAGAKATSPNVPLTEVSVDPYTNASSTHATEVEPDTFTWGNTTIGTFQVGRFFDGGSSNIGWSTTTDNGATWANGFLPGITVYSTPPGSHQRVSDTAVAYDASHNVWMAVSLALEGGGAGDDVLVSRSTNGGTSWLNPVDAHVQGGLDKTWIACDSTATSPYYGHCYVEWDFNGGGNIIQMSTSTDGGLTWGPARATADSASGLGGQPLVQPSGRVIVPTSANDAGILSFVSTDGGNSWSNSVNAASSDDHGVGGSIRSSPLPSAEIDPQGKVYVVWQDCRFRAGCSADDIVMTTSTDGLTWTPVTRIPIDPINSTVDHFIPGIGVNKFNSGSPVQIALTYYYYPVANCSSNCQLNVGYVSSADGGTSWTLPIHLAGPMNPSWAPQTNQGYMVGDYISTSIGADGKARSVFAMANQPNGTVFDQGMYTPTTPLSLNMITLRHKPGTEMAIPGATKNLPARKGLPTSN